MASEEFLLTWHCAAVRGIATWRSILHTERGVATWRRSLSRALSACLISYSKKAGAHRISIALAIHSLDCTLQPPNRDF